MHDFEQPAQTAIDAADCGVARRGGEGDRLVPDTVVQNMGHPVCEVLRLEIGNHLQHHVHRGHAPGAGSDTTFECFQTIQNHRIAKQFLVGW